ncbi:hypothetical protein ACBJ59_36710 [Nonomuraea sp. MTCD27]|uniref:hypothetical protein n=1 Tax=Nonomuraea sp. MTCD27 TaxID=1676747 RepID=UPI0035C1DFB8
MKYAGDISFKYGKNANGDGWVAMFSCPSPGCGADATATSAVENGPYTGWCSNGHPLHINNVRNP